MDLDFPPPGTQWMHRSRDLSLASRVPILQMRKLRLGAVRPGARAQAEEAEADSNPGLNNWAAEQTLQGHRHLVSPTWPTTGQGLSRLQATPSRTIPFSGWLQAGIQTPTLILSS